MSVIAPGPPVRTTKPTGPTVAQWAVIASVVLLVVVVVVVGVAMSSQPYEPSPTGYDSAQWLRGYDYGLANPPYWLAPGESKEFHRSVLFKFVCKWGNGEQWVRGCMEGSMETWREQGWEGP